MGLPAAQTASPNTLAISVPSRPVEIVTTHSAAVHFCRRLVQELGVLRRFVEAMRRAPASVTPALIESSIEHHDQLLVALADFERAIAVLDTVEVSANDALRVFYFAGEVIRTSRSNDLEKLALQARDTLRPALQQKGLVR